MTATTDPRITDIAAAHGRRPGGLLPALHEIQHALGYIPGEAIPVLADAFNRSIAEIHGVVTFYEDFRTEPPVGAVVQVCRAEACQARGGREVEAAAERLAAERGDVEIRPVFCVGNCALGPNVVVDGTLCSGVGAATLPATVAAALGAPRRTGEQAGGGSLKVYVPGDSAARSVGSDAVAAAFGAAGTEVVRTGSRGMLWLEPLVELDTPAGRVAFGPVTPADVESVLAAMHSGAEHPLRLGPTDDLPWMQRQQRVTFRRVGVVDPRSPDDYEAHGGVAGCVPPSPVRRPPSWRR